MRRPRKLDPGNIFQRVDAFRQEQRERRLQETVERSRRVPHPDESTGKTLGKADADERDEQ